MKTVALLISMSFVFLTVAAGVPTVEIQPDQPRQTQMPLSTSSSDYQPAYKSNWDMHAHRKLGAGVGLTGIFGQIGGVADINFDGQNSAQVGFGNGKGFNTFFAGWKTSFESKFLSPYITLGYSRWYNSVSKDLRGNSYILDQVVTKNDLANGRIGVDFLLSNFGVQYNQLDSEWIGNSFFFEFNFLFSTARGVLIPAASVGSIYYF